MVEKTIKEITDRFADQLHEHCDSVRIFVTFPTDNGDGETAGYEVGRGNFYAQFGQVVEWVSLQDQFQRNWAIRKDTKDNEKE